MTGTPPEHEPALIVTLHDKPVGWYIGGKLAGHTGRVETCIVCGRGGVIVKRTSKGRRRYAHALRFWLDARHEPVCYVLVECKE